MCNNRNPLQCIIPPYMMEKLMQKTENKPAALKTRVQTFAIDERLRSHRQLFSRLSHEGKKVLSIATLKKKSKKVAVNREVYTANHKEVQPGKLVRKEGQAAVKDKDVNRAYDGGGYTWDFYYSVFKRN